MIETTMKLVDGTGQGIVTIHKMGIDDRPDGLFTPVTYVPDSVRTGPLLGNLVLLIIEPLQGLERLIDIRASPDTKRFDRKGMGCQMVLSPIQIAGTGNSDALGHGIEASLTFKFTTGFQQGVIRFAVVDHFLVEMEGEISTNLVTMPTSQFLFLFGHHAVRIVKLQIGDATQVLLMVRGIEEMGKEPLLQFRQVEGGRKRREWHG